MFNNQQIPPYYPTQQYMPYIPMPLNISQGQLTDTSSINTIDSTLKQNYIPLPMSQQQIMTYYVPVQQLAQQPMIIQHPQSTINSESSSSFSYIPKLETSIKKDNIPEQTIKLGLKINNINGESRLEEAIYYAKQISQLKFWAQDYRENRSVQKLMKTPNKIFYFDEPTKFLQFKSDYSKNMFHEKKVSCEKKDGEGVIQKQSKFHNKNKVLLSKILKFFQQKNLSQLHIPENLLQKILEITENVRQTGRRKIDNAIRKSDLYNHSHYNVLFLQLTEGTIYKIASKPKEVEVHKQVFNIDITQQIEKEDLECINFVKQCIYQLVNLHQRSQLTKCPQGVQEREYEYRALLGIQQMNQGHYISRF